MMDARHIRAPRCVTNTRGVVGGRYDDDSLA